MTGSNRCAMGRPEGPVLGICMHSAMADRIAPRGGEIRRVTCAGWCPGCGAGFQDGTGRGLAEMGGRAGRMAPSRRVAYVDRASPART